MRQSRVFSPSCLGAAATPGIVVAWRLRWWRWWWRFHTERQPARRRHLGSAYPPAALSDAAALWRCCSTAQPQLTERPGRL